MNYESLILDIDGTLWDSRALVAEGYNIQLRKEGLGHLCVDAEILKAQFGKVKDAIADDLFAEIPVPERYRLIDRCMDMERQHMQEDECRIGFPGVRETLAQLAEEHRIFIVSNCECGYPEILVEKLGLQGIFEDHLCHGDTGLPKGDTIRILMERNGITDAVYIGDTQGDCDASRKAGIPFIFCAYGFGSPDRWDAKLEDFRQLPEVLKTM